MAHGVGTITAIDKSAGAVTLDHQAIPEAGWPAMTMAFKVRSPAVLSTKPDTGAKKGDTPDTKFE